MGSGICKVFCVSSSFATELWALREGLALCVELSTQAMEVELDASATISLVASNINSNGIFLALLMIVVNCCYNYLRLKCHTPSRKPTATLMN